MAHHPVPGPEFIMLYSLSAGRTHDRRRQIACFALIQLLGSQTFSLIRKTVSAEFWQGLSQWEENCFQVSVDVVSTHA